MTTTITERTLSNTQAFEYLDQHFYAACGGDIEGAVSTIRSGDETVEELLEGLNSVSEEAWPVTAEQFESYLQRRGYIGETE